jgi:hypothetical protein
MCLQNNKIEVKLYLTPEELIDLGKFLKKKSADIQTLDGENGPGNPPKPPKP